MLRQCRLGVPANQRSGDLRLAPRAPGDTMAAPPPPCIFAEAEAAKADAFAFTVAVREKRDTGEVGTERPISSLGRPPLPLALRAISEDRLLTPRLPLLQRKRAHCFVVPALPRRGRDEA